MTPEFSALLHQRNDLLMSAFELLDGPHWRRFEVLASTAVSLRPIWRAHQYSPMPPNDLTKLELYLWRAAKIRGQLPPQTAWGMRTALLPFLVNR